jgi:hypothetical protein
VITSPSFSLSDGFCTSFCCSQWCFVWIGVMVRGSAARGNPSRRLPFFAHVLGIDPF